MASGAAPAFGSGSLFVELGGVRQRMQDPLADSTALLERLIHQIAKETDPEKYDDLAAEIWRVLEERERLRSALALRGSCRST